MKNALLFLFLLPGTLSGQTEYAAADIPAALSANAEMVVRLDETIFRIQADGDALIEETYVATIFKEEGKGAGAYGGQESRFSKIKLLKGRLFDASGKLVHSTKDEDIQEYGGAAEYEFTDQKSKYLSLEHPVYPYTVEFKKKTLMKGMMGIPASAIQRLGAAVEHWRYRLVAPPAFKYKWRTQNIEIQPKTSTEGKNTVTEWEVYQLPAIPDEPFNPYFRNIYSRLDFAPETISFDGHQGDFRSWNSVGRFFYDLNNNRETLSPATLTKVQEITAGKTTREKIAALYRITQENCRYVSIQLGIGGWQTFEALFVDQKKYGDCKALSNYTQALLKAAGIEAWEVSIFAGGDEAPDCDEAFPDPGFNHVILYVPGEDTWLECTSKTLPAGYLGSFTANRMALLYTPQGGKLVKTPALLPADNFEKTATKVKIREDGSAEITFQALFGGERHESYRHFALEETHETFEKSFMQNAAFSIQKLSELKVSADREHPEASSSYQAETSKFGTLSGKRMFVPLTKTSPFKCNLPSNDKRTLDLKMNEAYTLRDTFTLQFPPGFEAENVPPGKKVESEFGRYEMQIEKMTDRILAIRTVEIRPLQVPAARYNEVRQFLLDAAKVDAAQMVLIRR
jgi:transglutaminase-like putative cysteine protease